MTDIYRIVHIETLAKLLTWGCDWSPNQLKARGLQKKAVVHDSIMEKREETTIDLPPWGSVADYVGFYFGPLSPMLSAIHHGRVVECGNQGDMVYLVTEAELIANSGAGFIFTDGHPIMRYVTQFNDLNDLQKLPWQIITAKYWNNFVDGRCRRQSEFLTKDRFSLEHIKEIAVIDSAMQQRVSKLLVPSPFDPPITVRRNWYF